MLLDRQILIQLRRTLIALLNAVDDALGLPRTIQNRQERRFVK
jgi:hypothetical protein